MEHARDHVGGPAAHKGWADGLLRDEDFPTDGPAVLGERMMVHTDALTTVDEGRYHAARFLKRIAETELDMAQELHAAARCYKAEGGLLHEMHEATDGYGAEDTHLLKLAEPERRRRIAEVILQCRGYDAEAAEHIEKALAGMQTEPGEGGAS